MNQKVIEEHLEWITRQLGEEMDRDARLIWEQQEAKLKARLAEVQQLRTLSLSELKSLLAAVEKTIKSLKKMKGTVLESLYERREDIKEVIVAKQDESTVSASPEAK